MTRLALALPLVLGMATGCAVACDLEHPSGVAACTRQAVDRLPMSAIQAIGTHNSYKQAMPADELSAHHGLDPEGADSLDYAHPPLQVQLDLGLRALELDVYYDPVGGRYTTPPGAHRLGYASPPWSADDLAQMRAPGFKVMHLHDIDFRSQCVTLVRCLQQVDAWSQAHPWHAPIMISMNAKDGSGGPGAIAALPFDAVAFDALDAEIRQVVPASRLFQPQQLSMDAGWPSLGQMRGKLVLVLDEVPRKRALYRARATAPAMFVASDLIEEDPALLILNEPLAQSERIAQALKSGRLVRTRADADTHEARNHDVRRRDAAFASGAQFISTDFPLADPRWPDYRVVFPQGGFVRCQPQHPACTPLMDPPHAPY